MIRQWWLLILAVESIFSSLSLQSVAQKRKCAFQVKPQNSVYVSAGNVSDSVQTCEHTRCCVGYFLVVDGRPEVDLLACDIVEKSCPDTTCQAKGRFNDQVVKCVCNTHLCNANVVWSPGSEEQQFTDSYPIGTITIFLMGILAAVCLGVVAMRLRCLFQQRKQNPNSSFHDSPAAPLCSCLTTKTSEIDVSRIEVQQIVTSGDVATVWKGNYQGRTVAVKVFPLSRKHRFLTEKEVYELPLMKHAAIAHFLGTGTIGEDGGSRFIVLRCTDRGSLHASLSKHTNNWMMSLKLCQSVSLGLSYLHSDLHRHDLHKPPVAHRNLSSFNVLVKADGSCALSDFDNSTVLRWCSSRHVSQTTSKDLKFAMGTLCYTAPEVLEGSVNLNSSWCLQGDVYAAGLLVWEIWMRCSDLFDGDEVPPHALPYEPELGPNMTLEQLTWHVFHQEERPSGGELTELLMECWEPDPDARLTAQRVAERLATFKSSVSPDIVG